jgi:hypothetical protein
MKNKISSHDFYKNYYGHPIASLELLLQQLKHDCKSIVYLCGDSSLDNKYWLFPEQKVLLDPMIPESKMPSNTVNSHGGDIEQSPVQYGNIFKPEYVVKDVAFWVNWFLPKHIGCINCAVEESTIQERIDGGLNMHDCFIRDNIMEKDTLIVSMGGNDIALKPSWKTKISLASLMLTPYFLQSLSPALSYFCELFKEKIEYILFQMIAKRKPKRIIVCMIYYPDENAQSSCWADSALKWLGYDIYPDRLQSIIKLVFEEATKKISIPGTEVVPVPLFEVLNGKKTQDYVCRVEPSVIGGKKMGSLFAKLTIVGKKV